MKGFKVPHYSLFFGSFDHYNWTIKLVLFSILLLNLRSCSAVDQSYLMPEPTARVFLFSLERGPLLSITDRPNTDVVLTKPPGYFEAYMFECNATFPVQWTYTGEGAPIMTADVGRSFRNFFDPATYMYHTTMVMYHLEEQNSGRYVCRGIESQYHKVSVYFHLYVPGPDILLSTAEKLVKVGPHKEHITIPCGASDPTTVVNLYKGNHKGTYVRLETNSSIAYNPRKGFKLQHKVLKDPYGRYLCVAASSKKRVRISVVPQVTGGRVKRQQPDNKIYDAVPQLQFSYDNRYHRILCCSSTGVPPKVMYAGCTSIVDCEIKSACFRENKCEARDGSSSYYNKYVGLDPPGCTGESLRDDLNGDQGLFLCQDPTSTATQYQPYQLTRGNLYLSFEEAPQAELVMTLHRATDEELFVGSETEFRCNSSRFFFAFGVRWAFERTDGQLEFVSDDDVVNDAYFINAHRRHTTLKIPHSNIRAIVCVAPVWNSATDWRILSLPISISRVFRPPTPESFHPAAESIVSGDYLDAPTTTTTTTTTTSSTTTTPYPQLDPNSEHMQKLRRRILPVLYRTKYPIEQSLRTTAITTIPTAQTSREDRTTQSLLYNLAAVDHTEPTDYWQNIVNPSSREQENFHKYYYDTLDEVLLGTGNGASGDQFASLSQEEADLGIYNSTFDLSSIL